MVSSWEWFLFLGLPYYFVSRLAWWQCWQLWGLPPCVTHMHKHIIERWWHSRWGHCFKECFWGYNEGSWGESKPTSGFTLVSIVSSCRNLCNHLWHPPFLYLTLLYSPFGEFPGSNLALIDWMNGSETRVSPCHPVVINLVFAFMKWYGIIPHYPTGFQTHLYIIWSW